MILELKAGIAKTFLDSITPEKLDLVIKRHLMDSLISQIGNKIEIKYQYKYANGIDDKDGLEYLCYMQVLTDEESTTLYKKLKNERKR